MCRAVPTIDVIELGVGKCHAELQHMPVTSTSVASAMPPCHPSLMRTEAEVLHPEVHTEPGQGTRNVHQLGGHPAKPQASTHAAGVDRSV